MRQTSCPYDACDGRGWVIDEATNTAARCRCTTLRRRQRQLGRALRRLPQRHQDATWERPPIATSPAKPTLKDYCDALDANLADGRGLWLFGPARSTKTSAAALIAKSVNGSVELWQVERLLRRIRVTLREDSPISTWDFEAALIAADLLILDDFVPDGLTAFETETLFRIINERYNNRAAIVITTEFTVDELEQRLGSHGPGIVFRLGQICGRRVDLSPAARAA